MRAMLEPYAISLSAGGRGAGWLVDCDLSIVEEFFVDHSSDVWCYTARYS